MDISSQSDNLAKHRENFNFLHMCVYVCVWVGVKLDLSL